MSHIDTHVVISFSAESTLHTQLQTVFSKYNIHIATPEEPNKAIDIFYEIPFLLNHSNDINIVASICHELQTKFNIDCGEMLSHSFTDHDFYNAPLYELQSTGNSAKAFLSCKKERIQSITLCTSCGIQAYTQRSPLVMDTSKIGDRYMVNVSTAFWVISEKMASLMREWAITGYTLKNVIHHGKNPAKPVFQLIPTNTLPSWSAEMKHYSFVTEPEAICTACMIRGRIDFPYHYNQCDLEEHSITDVNVMTEWTSNGQIAYQPIFFSKRFRNLLIEHHITRDVRHMFAQNYQAKDWLFRPVIIIS